MSIIFIHHDMCDFELYDASSSDKMKKCIDKLFIGLHKGNDYNLMLIHIDYMFSGKTGRSIRSSIIKLNKLINNFLDKLADAVQYGSGFYVVNDI